ncbi:heterokaryon incompatibility protein-domain-containing protein [Schizothecium vesticola]|uniref:Heterokaryon incompatibility protein-domain-containing protein n=1 Tax=Schizothecium vesticola TaxID=314040 RepID=A0AA40F0G8_9PEZI|nr:heterokaryon incompatibility protein-domain-containing protein [Schizothecium vesticola]
MATYVYYPLDKANNEIRLVDIFPSANFEAPIELSITRVPFVVPPEHLLADCRQPLSEIAPTLPPGWHVEKTLDDRYIYSTWVGDYLRTSWNHPAGLNFGEPPRIPPAEFSPQFEALSWTWGEQAGTEAAWVLDREGNRSACRVRQNLAEAIRYLRQPCQPRRMWIDSICIDQENKEEQGHQVLRMKDIYRLAGRVVIWLGPAGPDTHLALEGLCSLGERVEISQSFSILPQPLYAGDYPWQQLTCGLTFSEATWRALNDLLVRPWFGRVWTIQESLLANRDSAFQCGSFTLPSGSFEKGYAALARPSTNSSSGTLKIPVMMRAMRRIGLRNMPISSILLCAMDMACSDPRDKVYGVLGLMPRDMMGGMAPDYSLTVSEVFVRTTLQHGTAGCRLGLLDHCDLGSKLLDGPSWSPNYTIHQSWVSRSTEGPLASGCFPSHWTSHVADGILEVEGVRHGTVADDVSPILDSKQSMVAFFRRAYQGQVEGITKGAHARDYAYAYHAGDLEDFFPGHGYPTLALATGNMLYMISSNIIPGGLRAGSLMASDPIGPVRFLYTDGGLAGIASCSAQRGDLVVVIPGCRLPKIVRPLSPSPTSHTAYQLVGSCDILGLSNAEALLGPLPEGYTAKYVRDCTRRRQTWFTNDETGARLGPLEDPRLDPLPAEWYTRELSGEGEETNEGFPLFEFVHRETGEATRMDPRCTREALIARGVRLETFELR